jgi:rhodanese-related sulfurtransferase
MGFLFVCAGVGLLSACNKTDAPPGTETVKSGSAMYQKITAAQAKEMMDSGKPFVLLDVRTEAEYAEKRIDGALLIPDYEISGRAAAGLPDTSALILVYCRSGRRSASAANELVRMGYTNIYDFGGLNDWPFDTVNGAVPK